MKSTTITCPNCKKSFELSAAIEQPIFEELQKRLASEYANKAEEAVAVRLRDLESQLKEKTRKIQISEQAELRLLTERREFEEQRLTFELEKAKQIEAERQNIRHEARTRALEMAGVQLRELQEKLVVRDEEYRLREAEKNQQLDDMKKKIDELRRKAEQGSQQIQGEVLELDLETALRRFFSDDQFAPVPKGVQGGDLLQRVRNDFGHDCGIMIWEFKRTKSWSDGWLNKLRDEQIAAKAQLAVLVSTTMPKDVASFECRDNVWITPPHLAIPLAAALRVAVVETAAVKRAATGRQDR